MERRLVNDGCRLGFEGGEPFADLADEAEARRVAAAWNACRGVRIEMLERLDVARLIGNAAPVWGIQ